MIRAFAGLVSLIAIAATSHSAFAQHSTFEYAPSPPDNPLRGLVPYSGEHNAKRFPHSMEFNYLPLSALMTGPSEFNWPPLEDLLDEVAGRGNQTTFRIWMEYPGRRDGIPKFLEAGGLKVTEWEYTNTDPFPRQLIRTPDYANPALRKALQSFIRAFGDQYDGDPRIACITAGLLGAWGEWHTYPRSELFAAKDVQREVMEAYASAFDTTQILLRYPAGVDAWAIAENHNRPFGYHDDSFAFATIETGRQEDDWFYMAALRAAGEPALNKWQTHMIGGEVRPELWAKIFDARPGIKGAQDFGECVRQTHVSWLMETGMFENDQPQERIDRAIEAVSRMGYEFYVSDAAATRSEDHLQVTVRLKNTGVAPFYHDWKIQLASLDEEGVVTRTWPTDWKITALLPDKERVWATQLPTASSTSPRLALRVVNPLPHGKPLRFANSPQRQRDDGWLLIAP